MRLRKKLKYHLAEFILIISFLWITWAIITDVIPDIWQTIGCDWLCQKCEYK